MREQIVNFRSYDGCNLEGTLVRAENESAALLFVHGITSSRDELGFHSDFAAFLGRSGVSSLRFDFRFHGKYESSLEDLTLCGIINDIDAAYEALCSHVIPATKRFFLVATSFGAGLSAYWASQASVPQLKKIILNAPVIDYEDDVLRRNGLIDDGVLASKAVKKLDQRGYVRSSDIRFGRALINELKYINGIAAIKQLKNRIEIFHGDQDEDVPISSSKKFKARETKLHVIKGVGHGFGVEGDEDLDYPETKQIHKTIYKKSLRIINSSL